MLKNLRGCSFSIGALLTLIGGVAVALSISTTERGSREDGLLAGVTVLVLTALFAQAKRQGGDFRRIHRSLSANACWGWRIEIGWRIVIATALLAIVGAKMIAVREAFPAPNYQSERFYFEIRSLKQSLLHGIQMLCLIFAIGYSPRRRGIGEPDDRSQRPLLRRLIGVVGAVGALAVLTGKLVDEGLIPFLVVTSVQGIEMATPLRFAPPNLNVLPIPRATTFFWVSLGSGVCAIAALSMTPRLLDRWAKGRSSLVEIIAYLLMIGPAVIFPIWAKAHGFRLLSPSYASAQIDFPAGIWALAAVLIAVPALFMVRAAMRRASAVAATAGGAEVVAPATQWRYHRLVAALVALAATVSAFASSWRQIFPFDESTFRLATLQMMSSFLMFSKNFFGYATAVAGIAVVFRRRSAGETATRGDAFEAPIARFCAMWLATSVALGGALSSLAIASVGWWFSPLTYWSV